MLSEKERQIRDKYCELEKKAAIEAQHGHFKKAIELENKATEIVRNYRRNK